MRTTSVWVLCGLSSALLACGDSKGACPSCAARDVAAGDDAGAALDGAMSDAVNRSVDGSTTPDGSPPIGDSGGSPPMGDGGGSRPIGDDGGSPTTEPLIEAGDLTYLGGYAIPAQTNPSDCALCRAGYGGSGLTFYDDPVEGPSLYLGAHAQNPGFMAQFKIPSALPVVSTNSADLPSLAFLQPFIDIMPGSGPPPGGCGEAPTNEAAYVYNGRLIVSMLCTYEGTGGIGVNKPTMVSSGTPGWNVLDAIAPSRASSGHMGPIPLEWRSLLGGPALIGAGEDSTVGSSSAGPSFSVFDPDSIGGSNSGNTLVFYPLEDEECDPAGTTVYDDCYDTQNDVFNGTSRYGGFGWPTGTRSILAVTTQGTGCYWYGTYDQGTSMGCPANDDPGNDWKGPHAPPYRFQIEAFDANDLLSVQTGKLSYSDVRPYGVWALQGMPDGYDSVDATFDPATNRLYIIQGYGEDPRVEVWQVAF